MDVRINSKSINLIQNLLFSASMEPCPVFYYVGGYRLGSLFQILGISLISLQINKIDLGLLFDFADAHSRLLKELLAQGKTQASGTINEEVDLDDLMDDPELEKLHADRIAALKKEAEKRQALKTKGHGEYREISEGDFLSKVTGTEKVICHFYHREFYRCKIMDKHLKSLTPRHVETKFIKLDAENAPFFVSKLGVQTLPCVILFRRGFNFLLMISCFVLGICCCISVLNLQL